MKDDIKKEFIQYLRWVLGFVIFCVAITVFGCSPKEKIITRYQEVKIPIKCQVAIPQRPEPVKNAVEMNLKILEYTEQLEAALRGCK